MKILTYTDVIALDEVSFIAGTSQAITFPIYQNGNLINLMGASASWSMSYYGTTDEVLTKTGTILLTTITPSGTSSLGIEVTLEPEDTINLHGKFIQQLTIIDFDGTTFIPAQGIITILPAIGVDVTDSNLVKNGRFDTDADWQKLTGWEIIGGKAVATNASEYFGIFQIIPSIIAGKTYRLQYTIEVMDGNFFVAVGSQSTITRNESGTYVDDIIAYLSGGDVFISPSSDSFTGTVDNVSLIELP